MAIEKPLTIDFENLGLMVSRPGDAIKSGAYTNLLNMTSFRAGYIQSRRGSAKVNPLTTLTDGVHSQGRLIVSSVGYNYQGANQFLYRNFSQIGSGFSGNPISFEDYKIYNAAKPHMIAFDTNQRMKDNATTLTNFGLAIGTTPATAVASAPIKKTIDPCETASNWTAVNCTVADDTVAPQESLKSMKITVAASTIGTATRTVSLDLSQFSVAADSDDDDFIHVWLKVDDPTNLIEIRIQFDVDPTVNDFTQNYYWRSIVSSVITPAVTKVITGKAERDLLIDSSGVLALDGLESADSRITTLDYEELIPGKNQWTRFYVAKKSFQRVGSSVNNWANVKAVQVSVQSSVANGCVVNVDDAFMQGGTGAKLDGTDFDWRYRYRSVTTGSKSPLSPVMATVVAVNKAKATVTVPNPTDTQVTHIDLYRRGATATDGWSFVKATAVSTWSGTVDILDGVADKSLGEISDSDQIELSNAASTAIVPTVLAIHADRAWVDDPANPDRLWFSRRFQIEEFTADGYIVVSKGGDRVRRPYQLDEQLFCFTDKTVYRITGTSDLNFRPEATGASRGLYSKYAICRSANLIFYRGYDGIYAMGGDGKPELISLEIDPIFHGLAGGAAGELQPIDTTVLLDERLSVFDNKLYFAYKATNGSRYEAVYDLVMKRWEQTDRSSFSYLVLDDLGQFYSGGPDGFVYQRDTTNADAGAAITMNWRTGFFDLGAAEDDKTFTEIILDIDPGGSTFNFTAYYNNGASSVNLSVTGTGRQLIPFPLNAGLGTKAKNIALGVNATNGSNVVKFYKATINSWTEARDSLKSSFDWTDMKDPRDKYFRRLILDLDTTGTTADVNVYLDGSTTQINSPAATFPAVSATGRQNLSLSLPFDTRGKIVKVQVSSTSATVRIKSYGFDFDFIVDSLDAKKYQTAWEDLNTMDRKYLNFLKLEIDTGGVNASVVIEKDGGTTVETFSTVNTSGRQIVYLSLASADNAFSTIRLKISSSASFRYYNHKFDVITQSDGLTRYQTDSTDLGKPAGKYLNNLELEIDTGGENATVKVYVDGADSGNPLETFTVNTATRKITYLSATTFDQSFTVIRIIITQATGTFRYWTHRFNVIALPDSLNHYQTDFANEGSDLTKYYNGIEVEIDTGGNDAVISIQGDGAVGIDAVTVNSSQRKVFFFGPTSYDVTFVLARLKITQATGTFRYFSHKILSIQQPPGLTTHALDWSDLGTPGRKYLNSLEVEIDPGGNTVTMKIQTEGSSTTVQTLTANHTGRKKVFFGTSVYDQAFTTIRLVISSVTPNTFKYFSHKFDVIPQPAGLLQMQTDWSNSGSGLLKYFRQIELDIDTQGCNVLVDLEMDGPSSGYQFALSTSSRQTITRSIPQDTLAKVSRIKLLSQAVATSISVVGSIGEATVTPVSMTGIRVGTFLLIDPAGNSETVQVKAVTVSTFTAVFTKTHSASSGAVSLASVFYYFGHLLDVDPQAVDASRYQTEYSTDGTQVDKFYRQLVVEISTGGANVDIAVEVDGAVATTFMSISTASRKEVFLAMPLDTRGKMSRLLITQSSGSITTFQYFGHKWDSLVDSTPVTQMQTEWSNLGKTAQKIWRQLVLEINTQGQNVTVAAQVDGSTAQSFATVNTSIRKEIYLSLPKDTKGNVGRITIVANTATRFIYYGHNWDVLDEPEQPTKHQTVWDYKGWPGDKRFRQLLLEIDTYNHDLTVNLEVDNAIVQTWTISTGTSGRTLLTRSVDADVIGKLCRLSFSSATGDLFSYYSHDLELLKDPLDVTRYDTYELDFGYTRWKFIRRIWIAGKTTATVTMKIYFDETLKHTATFSLSPSSGWARTPIKVPAGVKGQLCRFIFTSSSSFKLFLNQSDVEWHPLAGDRGYDRALLSGQAAA